MTHKKTYSRVFIILQEMKKNLGISADKIPNGYVKLEIKNTKCKICFYVQNFFEAFGKIHTIIRAKFHISR